MILRSAHREFPRRANSELIRPNREANLANREAPGNAHRAAVPLEPLSRRAVLATTAGVLLRPHAVSAQKPGRSYRIGILAGLPRGAPQSGIVIDEIGEAGFIEGKNLIVDWRLQGSPGQTAASVAELVRLAPDVLLVAGIPGMAAAQAATRTIPTLGVADDMVASGLVPSLARPGGNLTGSAFSRASSTASGRRC